MKMIKIKLLAHRFGWLALTVCLALPSVAQDRQTKSAEPVEAKPALRVAPARAQLDPVAALRAEIEQCAARCSIGGSGAIATPGGGTLDYSCDEIGNCACFGASDCVKMSDVCKEGTIGCNDQGCICEEG
jgi:hypothetical protein